MRRLYIGIDPTTATVPPPAAAPAAASPAPTPMPATPAAAVPAAVGGFFDTTIGKIYSLGSLLSGPVLAYHGYKRHDESILWGLGWWLAPLPWPIMMGIAVAQSVKDGKWRGFGQPIHKADRYQLNFTLADVDRAYEQGRKVGESDMLLRGR